MRRIEAAVVGTGWCGGIRAEALARHPLVERLHIAETREERLREVAAATGAATATTRWRELLEIPGIEAVYVCATPEQTHYPMAKAFLESGRHVFLEKPIALTLEEADELVALARRQGVFFTIGYSQRFNPKYAYVKKTVAEGTLGEPVSVLISRHITRGLGNKISGRVKLSPAAMEATHDIDFVLWCLAPAKPVKVYAQEVKRVMAPKNGAADCNWIMITMDNGVVVTIGAGWILPPGYPNFSSTWIEFVGSEGALMVDDTHRDVTLMRMSQPGAVFPISTMPGESAGHVFAGPMAGETAAFVEDVVRGRAPLVKPEEALLAMEVYTAADLSIERGEPVALPIPRNPQAERLSLTLTEGVL
ncbi:Gfo/Idh/MocA family protein [Caldovatus aquaticus]|uniref:Gfo/Idh/MocA family oxidoreductase n=1 Tax=Caldovatus aquaticus TaxID=2865671 RepID=A0ABS7EXH6_9PROT|nr:Gfo/Idh/MocA family oxidoreductase [Caldovatus aquaticus]MBW8267968.1 Gfo/Idh/MocA family oxidoreductase [Caldovatus aquaticus]